MTLIKDPLSPENAEKLEEAAKDISKAMADLYIAVCRCDNSQRRRLISDNLWILQTAQKYAEIVGNCETLTD